MVLECAGPPALSTTRDIPSAGGLAHSRTLTRGWFGSGSLFFAVMGGTHLRRETRQECVPRLPLPAGEGRGEGERAEVSSRPIDFQRFDCPLSLPHSQSLSRWEREATHGRFGGISTARVDSTRNSEQPRYPSALRKACLLFAVVWLALASFAAEWKTLESNFAHPPPEARPWVYWFIIDGNFSRAGITADLEAMQRAGIGGVILMEVEVGLPRGPVRFMSEEWRALFKHAVAEAERLGLQITLNAGPGWTGSGGPWVKPEQSMQHLVASATEISGPTNFSGVLLRPTPRKPYFGNGGLSPEMIKAQEDFYVDVAVLAFPRTTNGAVIADIDEKALYLRHPYSSRPGTKPFLPSPDSAGESVAGAIARERMIDLSAKLLPDGRLNWTAPPGEWTILRLGRTSTGANTRPAPQPGLGLESDKFDPAALDAHFAAYVGSLLRSIGPRLNQRTSGWTMLHIDSWEMGAQNWTGKFREEFKHRRGYDPLKYLPAYTGRVVDNPEITERFLWDVRLTAQELVLEKHAQHLKTLGHQHGLGLSIEPYDMNPTADLALGAVADVPMCEFWADGDGFETSFSCIEATSIAHTHGKPVVAAEAFTGGGGTSWMRHPGSMKNQADWAFAAGINRLVFHRYAHQPWLNVAPGMTMGFYGTQYERTQTWWELSGAWHEYLARCQFLLRQGVAVAEILYLTPEGAPHVFRPPPSALAGSRTLPDRRGYNFDGCDPQTLIERVSVCAGKLVLPDGASYQMLVLPQTPTMTPQLLTKVKQLLAGGALVVGPRPVKSPSLTDHPRCDAEVQRLADAVWGKRENAATSGPRKVGRGTLVATELKSNSQKPKALPSGMRWIWFNEAAPASAAPVGTRYFRSEFTIANAAEVMSAELHLTADNEFKARLNGRTVGEGSDFHVLAAFDVVAQLKSGTNELRITVVNGGDAPNPAGLLGAMVVRFRDGRELVMTTGASWLSATNVNGPWVAAKDLGPAGISPWGMPEMPAQDFRPPYPEYDFTAALLAQRGELPDFESSEPLRFHHRRLPAGEIFFISNPSAAAHEAACRFRVKDMQPEWWNPLTGERRALRTFKPTADGRTEVALSLGGSESGFVVFREKRSSRKPSVNAIEAKPSLTRLEIAGPWDVSFPPQHGASTSVLLDRLASLSEHPDTRVKYFSGVATYRTSFDWPTSTQSLPPGSIVLDLGDVHVMAEVRLNGRNLGTVWCAPFAVDVSVGIKPGRNELEVRVANLWPNRMIGDAQEADGTTSRLNGLATAWPEWLRQGEFPPANRISWSAYEPFKKDSPLPASGLIGPVTIRTRPH